MDIIISRYEKDLNWIKQFKNSRIFIYDKSNQINDYIKLPNIGREPHTFIYHIINNYDDLAEYSCFLQDCPFDHMINKDLSFIENSNSRLEFSHIGKDIRHRDTDGCPECWMELKKLIWDKYFINYPIKIEYREGGQFIVSKTAIHLRKKIFYEEILKEFDRTDIPVPYGPHVGKNKMPWMFEVFWECIFDKNLKSKYDNE